VSRAAAIALLLLDVDGVLTDGRLSYTDDGNEAKAFHVRDGSGIKLWQGSGKRVAIISGRNAMSVTRRAAELGIDIVKQGRHPKDDAYREVLAEAGVTPQQVCCVGDDLPDLPLMLASGLSIAVGDAAPEVKAIANHVVKVHGGHGAVREAIEWLMREQGTWDAAIQQYRQPVKGS
jgi:YrbI family 3-deoxy-D-manno-octulosonate 8-phosphate phosphatase